MGGRTDKKARTPVCACLGRQLLDGHLLHLLVRPGLHLAAEAGPVEHGAVRVRVRVPHPAGGVRVDGNGLARDDHGVDHLPLRVVHGEHVESAAPDLLGVHHGVQEPARAVRAPHHQRGAGGHVPPEVRHHAGLLLGRHAHQRRQEHGVVRRQLPGHVRHVRGAERHARLERAVAAHQAPRPVVGLPADVVVVEGGARKVARREHQGAQRERAGPDEGHARRRWARHVPRQQPVLQLAQQDVVVDVGEERQVLQRVVEGGQQVGVVRLQQRLRVGAEADQPAAHLLQLRAQPLHVHAAARDARRHELGEERVHLRRRAQGWQLRDGGGQAGDLVHQRRLGLLVLLRRHRHHRLLDDLHFFLDDLPLHLLLLVLLLLAHDDHDC
uniref:Uncharacterized protein n=1 Tax=Zea mays TaxID=4577 RepID=C0PD99_MAIZE|nr:unknown [Zea mays]